MVQKSELKIKVTGDTKGIQKSLKETQKRADKLKNSLGKAAKASGAISRTKCRNRCFSCSSQKARTS